MAKKLQQIIEEQDRLVLTDVLSTYNGRYFLWHLLEYCGIYQDIVGEEQMIHRGLGRREVGLKFLGDITNVDEEKVFQMMREAKDRAKNREELYGRENRPDTRPTERDIISGNYDSDYDFDADSGHESGDDELPEIGSGGAII